MKKFIAIANLLLVFSVHATVAANFSVEQKYEPLNAVLQNSLKAKLTKQFDPLLQAYVLVGNEGSSRPQSPFVFQLGSYTYAGPGLKLSLGAFTLSGDVRFRKYLIESSDPFVVQPRVDVQSLLTYEGYWDAQFTQTPVLMGFIEAYSETLFSTADFGNVAITSLMKFGAEAHVVRNGFLAAYVEPSVLLDTVGHYYNNRAELKFSGRIRYKPKPLELELTISYLLNQYFDVPLFEANPTPDRNTGIAAKFMLTLQI